MHIPVFFIFEYTCSGVRCSFSLSFAIAGLSSELHALSMTVAGNMLTGGLGA